MGIDLAAWRARIGLNYHHVSRPLQTRWKSSGGLLYQTRAASWGVGEVMDNTHPGTEGLYISCCSVIDTTVCGLFLAHAKREGWGWKGALPLERVHF